MCVCVCVCVCVSVCVSVCVCVCVCVCVYVVQVASQNYVAEAFNVLGELVICIHVRVIASALSLVPGSMYQHGQGVERNMEKAIKHYTSGAELGESRDWWCGGDC